jgi:hypothetical protein
MQYIKKIGIDNVLNAILVNENVRPAMLVQPIDNNEDTHNDPKTKYIINALKTLFPTLLYSSDYENYQGVIISKQDHNGKKINCEQMGKILGYPCYQDYVQYLTDGNKSIGYSISVFVKGKKFKPVQLIANACRDMSKLAEFQDLANKAKHTFNKSKYVALLSELYITDVYVEKYTIVPHNQIINHLISGDLLNQDEINEIKNVLLNMEFSTKLIKYFQLITHNPIHRGILLDLLISSDNATLSIYYPLPQSKYTEMKLIARAQEKQLIEVLT